MKLRSVIKGAAVTLCLSSALLLPAAAAEPSVTWGDVYCFSQTDFGTDASGILLTDVPDSRIGALRLGDRTVCAGDVLTKEQLAALTFVPSGDQAGEAVIAWITPAAQGSTAMTLKISSGKNEPPVAENSTFTTYKNIPGQVPLAVSDPENQPLTVTIVKAPKRGTLEVSEDGIVIYTPAENKVGKDSFTYTVTDPAGAVSQEATVRIVIEKPSDKETYCDLTDHPAQLAATWLREEGIYCGQTVSGQLLFQPEETVRRGEFIAMCVGLTGLDEEAESLSTGFVDEAETPQWLSPYVSTALKCGYISGIPTGDGLALQPQEEITQAEAAKMISSILGLTENSAHTVMGQAEDLPVWAAGAIEAVAQAELYTVTDAAAPLTRGEAAMLLHSAYLTAQDQAEESSLLSWAVE